MPNTFGQSKYYVDSLSENIKRGLRQKLRRREYPSRAPLGYLNDTIRKTILVDKATAPKVKKAFEFYAKGTYTFEAISKFLAQNGIKSSSGKLPHKDRVKFMLQNPFYYGHFRYNGEIYEGIHKPIISKKLFDKVQEVLIERGKSVPKEPYNFPFAGFIRCGECSYMVTGEKHTKHYRRTNRTVTYIYYHCTKKSKTHRCQQLYINQEKLLPQINNLIQKVSIPVDWGEEFLRRIEEEEKEKSQSLRAIAQEIEDQIKALNLKLEKLLDTYLENVIDRENYLQKKEKLMGERKTLREKLRQLEQSPNDWLEPYLRKRKSPLYQ